MNAVRRIAVAVAVMILCGCSKHTSLPFTPQTPEPDPDLRAHQAYLEWGSFPIGVDGALARPSASTSTRWAKAVLGSNRLAGDPNVVVVGTGCLPAVIQNCAGSFPDYRIHYFVDDELWWDRPTSVVHPQTWGQAFYGNIWTPPDTGLHTIRIVLDATNRYPEVDETNNEASLRVRVIPGDLVAGMIEIIDWSSGYPRRVDTAPAGRPLSVVTWSFSHGDYTNHRSIFEVNGTPLFDRRMSLRGGTLFPEIKIDTVQFVPPTSGVYTFQRRVDPDREFMDGDRSDDVSTATLLVTSGP